MEIQAKNNLRTQGGKQKVEQVGRVAWRHRRYRMEVVSIEISCVTQGAQTGAL